MEKSILGDGLAAMHPQWNDAYMGVMQSSELYLPQIQYLTSFKGQELDLESHIKKIYTSTLWSPVELYMQASPDPSE